MRRILVAGGLAGLLALAACGEGREDVAERGEERGSTTSSQTSTRAESCVETYSPEALAGRAFAFDGTVTRIEMRSDPKAPAEEGEIPLATFEVHAWYLGGSGPSAEVWMPGANVETSAGSVAAEVGSRLLVAGEPRWGGEPLDDPIAWTCGFTQPWSEEAASEWEAATA